MNNVFVNLHGLKKIANSVMGMAFNQLTPDEMKRTRQAYVEDRIGDEEDPFAVKREAPAGLQDEREPIPANICIAIWAAARSQILNNALPGQEGWLVPMTPRDCASLNYKEAASAVATDAVANTMIAKYGSAASGSQIKAEATAKQEAYLEIARSIEAEILSNEDGRTVDQIIETLKPEQQYQLVCKYIEGLEGMLANKADILHSKGKTMRDDSKKQIVGEMTITEADLEDMRLYRDSLVATHGIEVEDSVAA